MTATFNPSTITTGGSSTLTLKLTGPKIVGTGLALFALLDPVQLLVTARSIFAGDAIGLLERRGARDLDLISVVIGPHDDESQLAHAR